MAKDRSEVVQWYLSNYALFEEGLNGLKQARFQDVRKAALARFSEIGFPTMKDEDWKYTNVVPILEHKFKVQPDSCKISSAALSKVLFEDLDASILVFVNGIYQADLSQIKDDNGIIIDDLKKAILSDNSIIDNHLGHYADFQNESFTALNTLFTQDGTFIYVPENTTVKHPIHVVYMTEGGAEPISHPRNLFVVGKSSQVSIIESYNALSDGPYFNNVVSEIFVDANAHVEHVKIQEESLKAFHVSNIQVHQERDSTYSMVNIDLGGALTRNNLNVLLNDENCESHLFGFYFGAGRQHIDNHTFVDHAMPNCFSNELYKGILDDKAQGVFNGKILVRQDAQKTNALQSNKTLLLTNDAKINSKPQLEIFADDVKCTHGATIGQLDDEALFYLRARGIGENMASAMLRHAFISDVLENIKIDTIRERLDRHIIERFTSGKVA